MLTISMKTFAKIQYFLIQFFCFRIFFVYLLFFQLSSTGSDTEKKQTAKKNIKAMMLPFCWFCNPAGLSMSICNNTQQKK